MTDKQLADTKARLDGMHAALNNFGVFMTQDGNDASARGQQAFAAARAAGRLNDVGAVWRAMRDIPRVFVKSSTKYCDGQQSAYGGKHEVERWRADNAIAPTYHTNGDFTAALVLLGYKVRWPRNGKNAHFWASLLPQASPDDADASSGSRKRSFLETVRKEPPV